MPAALSVSPIRDQRSMVGDRIHSTPDDVRAGWEEWVAIHGLSLRNRRGDFSTDLRPSRKVVVAYISGGKWVADCPECNGGIACWDENPHGCCLDCGTIFRVQFPAKAEMDRAVELLAQRDQEHLRSWHVHQGEPVDKLAQENEMLQRQKILAGAVGVDAIRDILGDDAVAKLSEAGVV